MADGNLQGPNKWRFDYCSKDLEELKRFEKSVYSIFSVKGKVRPCTTNKYGTMNYGVNCRPLAKTLFLIGVPFGNKVLKKYLIPKWILSDKECFRVFAKRYIDCEGGVDLINKAVSFEIYKSTELVENSIIFLNQFKKALKKYFGIKTLNPFKLSSKIKRKSGAFVQASRLRIKGKKELTRFYLKVGFDNKFKTEKLKLAIS
ncbi:hypothetical protein KKG83_08235 [Candidatus Micrarchaeota archaeon]|nr:hypothetical protein [Candidatus Micrarchaeota archaeon]